MLSRRELQRKPKKDRRGERKLKDRSYGKEDKREKTVREEEWRGTSKSVIE